MQAEDDFLGHPDAECFEGRAATSAPAVADTAAAMFTERLWYMGALVPQGDVVFGAGLGYYPNRGVMDGYVSVSAGGRQHNVRASRRCGGTPLETAVGPIRITVLQGLARHRIELLPGGSDLALDLTFEATLPPNDEGRDRVHRHGELVADVSRFVQFGHYTGWLQLDGKRTEVCSGECRGARDRSWGLRTEARTDASAPPVTRFRPMLFLWVCAQFEGRGIHVFLKEDAPGQVRSLVANETYADPGRPARDIVAVEHDLEWQHDPFAQRLAGGELRLRFADGERKTLRLNVQPGWLSLKAGMYGGYRGWFQGDDKGALHTEADTWDLLDPIVRKDLRTLADQSIAFADDGEIGYGTLQGGVSAGYAAYAEIQHLPMM